MDRDKRWDRTQKAYDLLVDGKAEHHADTAEAGRAGGVRARRDRRVHRADHGRRRGAHPPRRRGDRLQLPARPDAPDHADAELRRRVDASASRTRRTLTEYEEDWDYPVVFPPERPGDHARAGDRRAPGARQLHVAETEKYPHVTYFFNGGEEHPYAGRGARARAVAARRADLRPQAGDERARGGRRVRRSTWREDEPAFAIINFANPDMVGHTGVIEAAVKAVETVDACLGRVVEAVHATGGALHRHRRPRQLRPHARGRRLAQHGALARTRCRSSSPRGADGARRRGHPRRRRADGARAARASSSRRR